jgi:hypothetical protein
MAPAARKASPWRSVTPTDLEQMSEGWFSDLRGIRYLVDLGGERLELNA